MASKSDFIPLSFNSQGVTATSFENFFTLNWGEVSCILGSDDLWFKWWRVYFNAYDYLGGWLIVEFYSTWDPDKVDVRFTLWTSK